MVSQASSCFRSAAEPSRSEPGEHGRVILGPDSAEGDSAGSGPFGGEGPPLELTPARRPGAMFRVLVGSYGGRGGDYRGHCVIRNLAARARLGPTDMAVATQAHSTDGSALTGQYGGLAYICSQEHSRLS